MRTFLLCLAATTKIGLLSSRLRFTFWRYRPCHVVLGWLVISVLTLTSQGAEIGEVYAFADYYNPSGLLLADDGALYGTASGALNTGIVFRVTMNGEFTSLAGLSPTIASPFEGGPLIREPNGAFYGASYSGGAYNYGSIFRVSSDGIVTRLASFNGTNGARPFAGLTRGRDGFFYGTTAYGGPSYTGGPGSVLAIPGTVFKVDTNGILTTIVAFNRTNGATPEARLLLSLDGDLYGTTLGGGDGSSGTIFRTTSGGALNTLVSFGGTNGAAPYGGLTQTADGTFYGTTSRGGTSDYGTLFRLGTNGAFTLLASFTGTNGSYPHSDLVQGSDGSLYGTTQFGGPAFDGSQNSGNGTVFRLLGNGSLVTLGAFAGTNGSGPLTVVAQASNGYLYGTCNTGGSHGSGNVFRIANRILLRISIQPDGGRSLSWNAVPGMNYKLQYCSDLNIALWNEIGGSVQATNVVMSTLDSSAGETQRFYRIVETSDP